MGPRSRDRGVDDFAGRVLERRIASMGPRSRDRGVLRAAAATTRWRIASMGPRSRDRGVDWFVQHFFSMSAQLQWGRGLATAECPPLQHLCGQWFRKDFARGRLLSSMVNHDCETYNAQEYGTAGLNTSRAGP